MFRGEGAPLGLDILETRIKVSQSTSVLSELPGPFIVRVLQTSEWTISRVPLNHIE